MTCTPTKRHLDRDRAEITERYRVKTVLISQGEGSTMNPFLTASMEPTFSIP